MSQSIAAPRASSAMEVSASRSFKTLALLSSIRGRHTLGGMHNRQPNANPNSFTARLHDETGRWPALYSSDFQFEPHEVAERQKVIDQVKVEWNNGAVINLMWHACNPARSNPCQWYGDQGVQSKMSDYEWDQLLTDGTAINRSWKTMMDDVAGYLAQLQDAGIEVMFRPLHEMNQSAFWWGGRPGPRGTAQLYRMTRDYFEHAKGLRNLVWVWNVQDFDSLRSDLDAYDPGSAYYDVLTLDVYGSDGRGFTDDKYQAVKQKAGGKPIGIGECDKLPDLDVLSQQPDWSFFMGWSELVFDHNDGSKINRIFHSDRVLTLDEVPAWRNQVPATTESFSHKIEASQFLNSSGVITGPSHDQGGGSSVGSIDTDDWLSYDTIHIPRSEIYELAFRVASPTGGRFQLERAGGSQVFDSFEVPSTGGWNEWTTVYRRVVLPAGPLQFGVKALQGGWNFHWFSVMLGGNQSGASVSQPGPVYATPSPAAARLARLTHYTSYPDPDSEECRRYNGCTWAGQFAALPGQVMSPEWVASQNIAAVHSDDFETYKLKTLRVSAGGRSIDVKVYDMCSDSDCNGCCTANRGDKGFLLDLEVHTAARLGSYDGEVSWSCLDCH